MTRTLDGSSGRRRTPAQAFARARAACLAFVAVWRPRPFAGADHPPGFAALACGAPRASTSGTCAIFSYEAK